MLKTRLIPSLLVDSQEHLVKTIQFKKRHYLGDPINSAYIFSGFDVDELLVLDIDASLESRTISFDFIKALASLTSVPLTVGGGIGSLLQIQKILSFGVERVALSANLSSNFELLEKAANQFGSSSISVIVNLKYDSNKIPLGYLGRPEIGEPKPIESLVTDIQNAGAGELIINHVDLEGTRKGFDNLLYEKINNILTIPLVAMGGCGKIDDIKSLITTAPLNGIACGSFFVYGNNQKEVLFNYVDQAEWLKCNFKSLISKGKIKENEN